MKKQGLDLKIHQILWRFAYVLCDFVSAWIAYTALYSYRKAVIEPARFGLETMHWDNFYSLGALITSILWIFSVGLIGLYINPIRKSRLTEIRLIIQVCFVFSTFYFLIFLLNDFVTDYKDYFKTAGIFSGIIFLGSILNRIVLGSFIQKNILSKKYSFPTLIIGSRSEIQKNLESLSLHSYWSGEIFSGWINTEEEEEDQDNQGSLSDIPMVGGIKNLSACINDLNIKDCIVALAPEKHHQLTNLILDLETSRVRTFMIPDTYGILSGQVKIDDHGVPLMEWHIDPMNPWQRNSKRLTDILISILVLVLISPLLMLLSIMVRLTGGPVFFSQLRIGKNQTIFNIYKFRTMRINAEKDGPQLSSEEDTRITSIGKFLRKYRLDELPQFWNVLKGDMSIVGPRPERSFYAEKIIAQAPQYRHVYKVRPGITSWGMVRFGYASNVEEMVSRMKYDLIYIENMSFFNDIKVLIYTVWTIIQGRGK